MGRQDRDHRPNDSSPVKLILLIVGLVVGIPAFLAVLVMCVIFALGYFVVTKTAEVGKEVVQTLDKEMERARKEQEDRRNAMLAAQKKLEPPPNLPPLVKLPGTNMSDLIPLIDPAKDAVENRRWEIVNNQLLCKEGSFVPRMQIPYIPPAEYDFVVTFSQPGLRNGISLIMPNPNGGSFFFFVGSENGNVYGFGSNPNKEGRFNMPLKVNSQYTATVQVRRNSVKALLGNTQLLSLNTDYRDLTVDDWRKIPDTRLLAVACDDPTTFQQVRVVEINGTGKRMR